MFLRIDPKAMGFCIFATKRLFDRVGGFDENIRLAEDAEFVKRAAKIRNLGFLDSTHITVSVRRFEKEGRLAHVKKGIRINLHRMFRGEILEEEIDYQFAQYDTIDDSEDAALLKKIERRLLKLDEARLAKAELAENVDPLFEESTKELRKVFKRRSRRSRSSESDC